MKYLFVIIPVILIFCGNSCKKDPPNPVNEQELITTLEYRLTTATNETVTLTFKDLDGDGGDAPVKTTESLAKNTSYAGKIFLYNEQNDEKEDIAAEVSEEANEHQFFFQTTVSGLTISYNDQDANGKPVGLSTNLSTTGAGSGTLTITLRHQPDKNATNVASGDITNAGGETDIAVTFDVQVE